MASKRINIKGKTFVESISEETIQQSVAAMAKRISDDYSTLNPVFVTVLNGAFVFAADLLRMLDFPCEYAFTKLSSYEGVSTTGNIIEQLPVTEDITGRHVVIIEDIVDTGYSMQFLLQQISKKNPASVEICTLSHKPEKCRVPGLRVKYVGMTLPEAFIVGYGLDYDGQGRQLRSIYTLAEE